MSENIINFGRWLGRPVAPFGNYTPSGKYLLVLCTKSFDYHTEGGYYLVKP